MADEYVRLYERLLHRGAPAVRLAR
jgi:hypothetical protein